MSVIWTEERLKRAMRSTMRDPIPKYRALIDASPAEMVAGIAVRIHRPDGTVEAVLPWDFYIGPEGER